MFSINYIRIYDDCDNSLRKNLKPGLFFFNDRYKENGSRIEKNNESVANRLPEFWNKNINIQAIVGQNGSGKSTILDLMYMAINNFSYLFDRGNSRPGASPLFYVKKLHVDLCFSIDIKVNEEIVEKQAVLSCNEDDVKLSVNNNDFEKTFKIDTILDEVSDKDDERKGMKDEGIKDLVKKFFYTIVSNYSMQSFISSNYKRSAYIHYYDRSNREKQKDESCEDNQCWINPIFHKNDGYIRSIVLNPYRDGGKINLENEMVLSKERLCALLIYGKKTGVTIFDPYVFNHLKVKKNDKIKHVLNEFVEKKFPLIEEVRPYDSVMERLVETRNSKEYSSILKSPASERTKQKVLRDDFICAFKEGKHPIFLEIAKKLQIKASTPDVIEAVVYIVFKILKIVDVYPSYQKYKGCFSIHSIHCALSISDSALFMELLDEIDRDKSHITRKIRRAINFIKVYNCHLPETCNFDFFNSKIEENSLEKINDLLPPPFYDYELYVDKKNANEEPISYGQLSSGEIQLLQTLSIHAYHIGNLLNVSDNRPKYKNINLVFDELEVCLHPEYQRQFVKRLIDMLNNLQNGNVHFNVMIVTHSPFILSDIPLKQILFLENGESKDKKLNTFGGNVGDMLYDSFFMKSTIGDFAEGKLKRLLEIRKKEEPTDAEKKEADAIYSCIGDPIISCLLEN